MAVLTDEERAARIAALVRELGQYEQRTAGAGSDEDRAKWDARADQVRQQLGAFGHTGMTPQKRASRRLVTDTEAR